jgi:PAS domain S-box-containing protein
MTISESADERDIRVQERTAELEKANHKQEEHICRYNQILEGINSILSNVMHAKTEKELANACLSVALKLTGSLIGFVGLVGDDGQLYDIAISEMGWNQCQMYDKTGHRSPPENLVVHGLYGSVIDNGNGFFTNKPLSHPDSIGLPFGHPPINSFLGVPLVLDGKTMGVIAVADREGGYSYEHQGDLEAIAPAVMHALQSNISEKALSGAYENLQVHSEELHVSNEELRTQSEQLHESNEALHESEEHYRMLFENMTEAFFLADVIYDSNGKPCDYHFLEVNPAYEYQVSIKKEQILGKSFFEIFSNANPITIERYSEVILSGQPVHFEVFSHAVNGKYLDVYAFSPEKGKLAVIFRDITKRKITEAKLQASEEKYRNIVETANEGIFVFDSDIKVIYANNKMAEILGYSPEEMVGKHGTDFVDEEYKGYTELRTEKRLQGIDEIHENKLVHRDGSTIWAIVSSKSIFDTTGKFNGILSMVTDITERKRAEEALRESEAKLRAVFSALTEGVVFLNKLGDVEDVNEAVQRSYSQTLEELSDPKLDPRSKIIRPDGTLFPVDEQPAIVALRTGEAVHDVEMGVPLSDGRLSWRLVNAQPAFDNQGNLIGAVASFFDISARKEAEAKLKEILDNLDNLVKERTAELERAYNLLKEMKKSTTASLIT